METIQYIALSMGIAWASGINLYAAVFMLGYLGSTGNFDLPPEMMVVTDPLVMTAAGLLQIKRPELIPPGIPYIHSFVYHLVQFWQ